MLAPRADSAPDALFASIAKPRKRHWRWALPLVAVVAGAALAGVVTWQLGEPDDPPAPAGDPLVEPAGPAEPAEPARADPEPAAATPDAVPEDDPAPAADEGGDLDSPPLAEVASGPRPGKPKGFKRKLKRRPSPGLRPPGRPAIADEAAAPLRDRDPVIEEEPLPEEPEPAATKAPAEPVAEKAAPSDPPPVEVASAQPSPAPAVQPPAPAVAPPKPTYQAPEVLQKRRIAGHDPEYPPMARKAKLRATVLVKIFIEPDGKVGFTKFLKSHPVFERTVLEAIRSWRFKPHTINGRPVGTYTVYKFVFQID